MVDMVVRHEHEIDIVNIYIRLSQPLAYCPAPYTHIDEQGNLPVADIIAVAVAAA